MGLRSVVARAFLCAVAAVAAPSGLSRDSSAQEEFFKAPLEAPPTKTPVGGQQVYSFSRLDPDFTALCTELEHAGRRERIVKAAELGIEREKDCISCRSFWKMVVSACGRLGPKPTRIPRKSSKQASSSVSSDGGGSSSTAATDSAGAGTESESEPQVKKVRDEHYPTVALIDQASRFSNAMYETDKGDGATAHMLHYFAKTVLDTPDLTATEREYYDILFTYLLAAWAGRVDTTKLPTPTPSSELHDLFDFN
jgi:hypothetical protein